MGLFDSIKAFVAKLIDNPIKTGIVAFLIWRILKSESNKESLFCEDVKVIARKNGKELIYDDKRNMYALIDGHIIKYYDNEDRARKNFEGIKRGRGVMEKINLLHEKLCRSSDMKEVLKLKEKYLKEVKDKNGSILLGGDKVITPEGKKGYVYQFHNGEVRVTAKPQTDLIGWYKPEELQKESLKVKRLYEKLCKEMIFEPGDSVSTDDGNDGDVVRQQGNNVLIKFSGGLPKWYNIQKVVLNEKLCKEGVGDFKVGDKVRQTTAGKRKGQVIRIGGIPPITVKFDDGAVWGFSKKSIDDGELIKESLRIKTLHEKLCKEGYYKKITDNSGMKFGGYIKPNDNKIKNLNVGIGDIISDGDKWFAIEESLSSESVCKEAVMTKTQFEVKLNDLLSRQKDAFRNGNMSEVNVLQSQINQMRKDYTVLTRESFSKINLLHEKICKEAMIKIPIARIKDAENADCDILKTDALYAYCDKQDAKRCDSADIKYVGI